ncbi:oligosaccharide flippase family protein [Vibrio parahaemolyticus]|nr:oligosaccharide flippase family protein [Vibrio parahaemolyticus]
MTLGFPLLVIPVILNKIGLERYGEYVFYSSVISYFVYLVNFGIDESATLIINRFEGKDINDIISSIFATKVIILSITVVILYLIYVIFIDDDVFVYFLSLIFVEAFNFLWYFQYSQRLSVISTTTLTSKLLFFCLILFFITPGSQASDVVLILSLSTLLPNLFALSLVTRKHLFYGKPSVENIKYIFKESYVIFFTNLVPMFKDKIGNILLGIISSMELVGLFDIITKFYQVMLIPINIINQAIFPQQVRKKSRVIFDKLMKLMVFYWVIVMLIGLSCFVLAKNMPLDYFFWNEYVVPNVNVLLILIFCLLPYSMSLSLAKNLFYPFNITKFVFTSTVVSTLVYLTCAFGFYMLSDITPLTLFISMFFATSIEGYIRYIKAKKEGLISKLL